MRRQHTPARKQEGFTRLPPSIQQGILALERAIAEGHPPTTTDEVAAILREAEAEHTTVPRPVEVAV